MARSRSAVAAAPQPRAYVSESARLAQRTEYTAEVAGDFVLHYLVQQLEWDAKQREVDAREFGEKLARNPAHALSWSREAFVAVAKMEVSRGLLQQIVEQKTSGDGVYSGRTALSIVRGVRVALTRFVISGARWPSRSSSAQSDEYERVTLAARAEILETLLSKMSYYGLLEQDYGY